MPPSLTPAALLREMDPFRDLPEEVLAQLAGTATFLASSSAPRWPARPHDSATTLFEGEPGAPHTFVPVSPPSDGERPFRAGSILALDSRVLRRAYLDAPVLFRTHPSHAAAQSLQSRVSETLRHETAFRNASPELLSDLETRLPVRVHAGGERIFSQGAISEYLLIVVSGMVRPSQHQPDGGIKIFSPLGSGAVVGEMGVVLGDTRAADLTAVRDCECLVMDQEIYRSLLVAHPMEISRILGGVIRGHLVAATERQPHSHPSAIAIVPLDAPENAVMAAHELLPAFTALGRVSALTREDGLAMSEFGHGIETAHLNALEKSVDLLLYVADEVEGAWRDCCLRHADHVLFVTSWDAETALRPVEVQFAENKTHSMKRHSLLVLHPAQAPRPRRAREWRAERENAPQHHLRLSTPADAGRVARTLVGKARGLVLGGGGARGFAHVGVIRELKSRGIDVDMVGGNSMGALIGAQFAKGDSPDEILENTLALTRKGERPTLPLVSLVGGRRFARSLENMFEGLTFEDLWTPFFTVACDLTQATTEVLDSGPLHFAVRASNSPAGIFPPTLKQGHLLVDGAILNNVPVDAMRDRVGSGQVIAVDVNPREDLVVDASLERFGPLDVLTRLFSRRTEKLPTLPEILVRAGIVGGIAHRDQTKAMADLLIEPPVGRFPLIGYGQAHTIAQVGQDAARARLS